MSARANPSRGRSDPRGVEIARRNRTLLGKLGVIVVAMFGFGYALVPLYEKICEVTGLRDIDRADTAVNTQVDGTRFVRIEFDTNLHDMPWKFRALQFTAEVHPGAVTQVESLDRRLGRVGEVGKHPWRGAGLVLVGLLVLFPVGNI